MSHDRAQYSSDWRTRVQKARRNYRCDACGGTIRAKSPYLNHDDRASNKRWQGREHIDCQAAWWQVDINHLLESLGSLPHAAPPEDAVLDILEHIPVTISAATQQIHQVDWHLPESYRRQILHTPDAALRTAAFEDIKLALGLFVDCLIRTTGHKEASLQLSNIMQQMRQVAETATINQLLLKHTTDQTNS